MASLSTEGRVWRVDKPLQEGLETEAVFPSSTDIKEEYDVILIGAGFTGMTAARDISKDAKVLLLDARDRVGGRTWVSKVDGQEFEMGGTWIHWFQPYLWTEVLRYDLQKNVVTASGTSAPENVYFNNHSVLEIATDYESAAARIDRLFKAFMTIDGLNLKDIVPRPYDNFHASEVYAKYDKLNCQDRIDMMDLSPAEKNLMETIVGHFGLVTAAEIGFAEMAHWLALSGITSDMINETMGTYKLSNGGTTSIFKGMMSDYTGDILLSSAVKLISQDSHCVTVTLHSGQSFKAKYAICTVPLNVVKDLEFSPPLSPLRQAAVDEGHPGRGGKIHFAVSPPVAPFTTSSTAPCELTFLFTDHENEAKDTSYLVSFVHAASKLQDFSDSEEVKQAALAMVPKERPLNIVSYVYHDWRKDPYAQGTWCCFEADYTTKYLRELQSSHGERVLMASSDWAQGWRGCMDGGIEQGIVSGREVLRLLKAESAVAKAVDGLKIH